MSDCQVCHQASSRYKCPKCFIRYCSVACFKSHDCQKVTVQPQEIKDHPPSQNIPEDVLPSQQLQSLLKHLQSHLTSPLLGTIMRHIDSAPTQEEALARLQKARDTSPEFEVFANAFLDQLSTKDAL